MSNSTTSIKDPITTAGLGFIAVFLLALVERKLLMGTTDVSWFITLAERVLDGQRLYVDFIETNPPLVVFIHMPAVIAARLLGLRPEVTFDAMVFMLAVASLWATLKILPTDKLPFTRFGDWFAVTTFAVLVALPSAIFGQREHIALLFYLPVLAISIRRSTGEPVNRLTMIIGGLALGFVVSIKPHFALAPIAVAIAAGVQTRSWRPFFALENILAVFVLAIYVALTWIFYPTFWKDLLPLFALLYLPVRRPLISMLNGGLPILLAELFFLAGYFAVAQGKSLLRPWVVQTFAAALGFLLAAIIQGKGWPYHFYPALALIILVFVGLAVSDPIAEPLGIKPPSQRNQLIFAGLLCLQSVIWFNGALDARDIEAPLRAIKERPRVVSMVTDFGVVFPAVRSIDGTFIGRTFSRWIPYHAAGLAAAPNFDRSLLPAFRAAEDADRKGLTSDILTGHPDILVVERKPFDVFEWAKRDPALAAVLTCFRSASTLQLGGDDVSGPAFDIELFASDGRPPSADGCPAP